MKLSNAQQSALEKISAGGCRNIVPWRMNGKWWVVDRDGDQICRPTTLEALRQKKLVTIDSARIGEHDMPIKITDAGRQYLKEPANVE